MAIMTPEQYRESIRDSRVVYFNGERIEDVTRHPSLKVCVDMCATDYVLPQDPRHRDLFVTKNGEGEDVSFVFVQAKTVEDLLRRRQIIQTCARTNFGFPGGAHFTGIDALNAFGVLSRRMDLQLGTSYSERVEAYRKYLQKHDSALAVAMTDAKGDRTLRPSKQEPHKDYYLRIVDESSQGVTVRGAKSHISMAPCVNEMIVMPCRNMSEVDRDYAVAFALPIDTKGVSYICSAREAVEEGNYFDYPYSASINSAEAIVIFDDVFVPMERVFLKGEWQFSGPSAYMFANFHRLSADAYKYPELELLVGTAALMAEYNGLERTSHIMDKLSWLAMYAEGIEALGLAACQNPVAEPGTDLVYPHPMYSNIAKFHFADNYHQARKHLADITGGIIATVPSGKDFLNPETQHMLDKYLGGKAGIPAEHRMRAIHLAKDLCAAWHAGATLHGEGSLAAQRVSIFALADFEKYKTAARRAARISSGAEHPAYADIPPFPHDGQKGRK